MYISVREKKKGKKDNYLPGYVGERIFSECQPSSSSPVPFVSPSCTVT